MRKRAAALVVVVAMAGVSLIAAQSVGAARSVRGFDGTTITLAGMGIASIFPASETGAQARIKRFNDTNEVKGIKLKLAEVADDKQDPATSVSEARRLVTQVGAFAIVPDISLTNPEAYFAQQHVPYFGGGFDATYCSNKPSAALWGFSVSGCAVPSKPSFVMTQPGQYQYVSKKSGKTHPTMAILGGDDATGVNEARVEAKRAQGSGFKVVSVKNNAPATSGISDFTPYVQQLLKADKGSQPDSIFCLMSTPCIGLYGLLTQSGFKGVFLHALYSDVLVKPMAGSATPANVVSPLENTAGYRQLKADFEAVKPGSSAKLDYGGIFSYAAVDAFAQALKKAAKGGKGNITPENVRNATSTMTWGIKGVIGPVQYPKSTVMPYPSCQDVLVSDGTHWNTVEPYTCTTKSVSPNIKIG